MWCGVVCVVWEGGAKSRLRRAKTTDDLESGRWDQDMRGGLYIRGASKPDLHTPSRYQSEGYLAVSQRSQGASTWRRPMRATSPVSWPADTASSQRTPSTHQHQPIMVRCGCPFPSALGALRYTPSTCRQVAPLSPLFSAFACASSSAPASTLRLRLRPHPRPRGYARHD